MDKTEKNESCSTDEPLASKSESEANGIREEKGKSRKANKPLMERRRRERINNCLEQLKTFLMDATKKESSYYSKLEKADILEMTVKYLKNLKRQQMTVANHTPTPNPPIMDKYIAGFNECTYEVNKYLNSINGISDDVRGRLIGHLADSLHKSNTLLHKPSTCTQTLSSPANPTMPQTVHMQGPIISGTTNKSVCFQTLQSPQLQIVPAKMNSGETIYVLVNAQNIPVLGNPVYQTGHVPVIQNMISPVPVQLGDPQNNNTSTPVSNNSIRNNTTLTPVFNSVQHNNNSISLINNSATPQSTNNAFFDFTLPDNMSPRQMEKNILHSTPNTSLGNCDNNTSSFTNYTPPYYPHTGPILTGIDAENHLVLQQQRQKQESTFSTNRTSAIEIVRAQDNSSVCDSHNTSASSDNSVNSGESSSLNDKGVLPTTNQHHKIERYFDLNRPGPSHASMPYLDPMWRPW